MTDTEKTIELMGASGFHFGSERARRHPSTLPFVFGVKNNIEVINLEKAHDALEKAKEYIRGLGKEGKKVVFVGNKAEARELVKTAATSIKQPYVAERWIGGTLTNFDEMKKRIARLEELTGKHSGAILGKYTKRERGRLAHEGKNLERYFRGVVDMIDIPTAMIVIDSDKESIAITEAKRLNVKVVSLSSTDCNIGLVDYPVVGNDKSQASIKYFLSEMVKAYKGS